MEERSAKVIDPEKFEREYFEGGGFHQNILSKKKEGTDVTVYLGNIAPGKSHDWHSHEQDEVMYIVQGAGKYVLESGEIHYKAGNFFFMPKGTKHKNVTLSKENVIIVAIFNPAVI